jgi:hypothetical protein
MKLYVHVSISQFCENTKKVVLGPSGDSIKVNGSQIVVKNELEGLKFSKEQYCEYIRYYCLGAETQVNKEFDVFNEEEEEDVDIL